MAESEDNLQRMLEFNQTANKYNLSISIPKTKSMTIKGTDPMQMQAATKRPTNQTSDEP